MKPLTDERKEKILKDIIKSISSIYTLAPGEFTLMMIMEALHEQGCNISRHKTRYRIDKLVDANILSVREFADEGKKTMVYSPTRDTAYDEILEILIEP